MFFGSLFPILSMIIGYPLALSAGLGTAGLGYGMSIAAWISFISLRLYFLRSQFSVYGIYNCDTKGLLNRISELLKLGFPMAFQSISEWGNLFVLSMMLAGISKQVGIAANGSFQITAAFTLVSMGLGQGISVKVSQQLGKLKVSRDQENEEGIMAHNANAKSLGYGGIFLAVMIALIFSAVLFGAAEQIQTLFVERSDQDHDNTLHLARTMLMTNAVSLVFDTIRNMAASALAGGKDVFFAPVFSFLTMSVLSLSAGFAVTEYLHRDPNYLFITRTAGIFVASLAIFFRLYRKNYATNNANLTARPGIFGYTDPNSYAGRTAALLRDSGLAY